MLNEAMCAEMKALGTNGPARIDAVVRWLNAHLPREQATAMINNRLFTAPMVQAFEHIMRSLSSSRPTRRRSARRLWPRSRFAWRQ
jgi:hypothetical protein